MLVCILYLVKLFLFLFYCILVLAVLAFIIAYKRPYFSKAITFDPDEKHKDLTISEDKTQVFLRGSSTKHSKDRRAASANILASQSFTTGKHYWEVDIKNGEASVQRLGVFVDCDKGRVRFYDVSTGNVLHTFIIRFKGAVCPAFKGQQNVLGFQKGPERCLRFRR
uniref:B30.2/SPRY domain-containing protein n=1 Tax=Electrophorus electricus TaxID=8005 RepID=A0AAY5F2L3_ELEEL